MSCISIHFTAATCPMCTRSICSRQQSSANYGRTQPRYATATIAAFNTTAQTPNALPNIWNVACALPQPSSPSSPVPSSGAPTPDHCHDCRRQRERGCNPQGIVDTLGRGCRLHSQSCHPAVSSSLLLRNQGKQRLSTRLLTQEVAMAASHAVILDAGFMTLDQDWAQPCTSLSR